MPGADTKLCAAHGCTERIKRRLLMCPRHWRMLPIEIRDRVYLTLDAWEHGHGSVRPYIQAVADAQLHLARREGKSAQIIAAIEAEIAQYQKGGK